MVGIASFSSRTPAIRIERPRIRATTSDSPAIFSGQAHNDYWKDPMSSAISSKRSSNQPDDATEPLLKRSRKEPFGVPTTDQFARLISYVLPTSWRRPSCSWRATSSTRPPAGPSTRSDAVRNSDIDPHECLRRRLADRGRIATLANPPTDPAMGLVLAGSCHSVTCWSRRRTASIEMFLHRPRSKLPWSFG